MHVFIHTHIHILQNLKTYENFKDLRTVWSATEKQKGATEPPMLCLASWPGSAVPDAILAGLCCPRTQALGTCISK